ncbi:phosphomannomutase/phosphoglucomutase [Halotalea alkalilenta]|uniref:phosphomannomutase/phosphoglucomutase n=1 Tax=Halotalea alkalilenta TaxID=376489 RepID=UPI0004871093|nr:phosphomannomutase/phosphoglucomutase [Halotalea alkalilenta]
MTRTTIPLSAFRAYDIRGVVGRDISTYGVRLLGQAIGSEARRRGEQSIVVGRDGRLSGPELAGALIEGIRAAGVEAIDVGRVPTPVVYFAAATLEGTRSGVAVTGSHNPADYNGFKIVLAGETLANQAITDLHRRIEAEDFTTGDGQLRQHDVRPAYLERILSGIEIGRPLRVVVDCGNGVTGELGPQLVARLGMETIPLFDDIDGRFPNHHPDPGKLENLRDLIIKVRETGADIGLAFDGDGDRLGVVTPRGEVIFPDRLMMAFSEDLLEREPGARIIFDVKCTGNLPALIERAGGIPEMSPTGHSLIKARMKQTGAVLAGEMSGHIFFKERWYGFDDGLYCAARLLEILSGQRQDADAFFARYPQDLGTAEINVEVTDENKFAIVERLAREVDFGAEATKTTIDGIRVDYPDGWGLCRASNTTPMLVLRFEGKNAQALARVQVLFRTALHDIVPGANIGI